MNIRPDRDEAATTPRESSRDGDPRQRDGQDARTLDAGERERAKDDPSRAPESGTP
ncbi:MAG TPA: hypothetical protein VEY50_00240 [Lysobacter sp.]|nr:hypothetical protein [Lysobacter sp.]